MNPLSRILRHPLLTLTLGLAMIAGCSMLLAQDVAARGGAIVGVDVSRADLPRPETTLAWWARWGAVNMTPICWLGYLLAFDGLLTLLARWRGDPAISPLRSRPLRFLTAWLTSIPVWCFFDWLNFYYLDAWRYHGLPPLFWQRVGGYIVAFAAVTPGMFLAAHACQHLGFRKIHFADASSARCRFFTWFGVLAAPAVIVVLVTILLLKHEGELGEPRAIAGTLLLFLGPATAAAVRFRSPRAVAFAIGVAFTGWSLAVCDPLANMTLWVGLVYLLDPLNATLGASRGTPSLLADWAAGRWGRTLALMTGGAFCGLMWELWNYWAIAKWTYHLPFMGPWQEVRYFEMPVLGFFGFLPFACECWVVLNTIILGLKVARLNTAESLPDAVDVL